MPAAPPYALCVAPASGTYALGPADGDLLVATFREGVAQKAGHDLILEVRDWQATVEVGADGRPASVSLDADPRSLHVRRGLHGAKPLSDSDRASIRDNIARKVLGSAPIAFRSTRVEAAVGRLAVTGDLTMAQATRPIAFEVAVDETGRASAGVALRQSEWGITPYRALMGALKVRDEVEVSLDARLPAR
jgi:hypothetical protein